MKWNVILRDYETGKFKPYNIFEHEAFRLAIEKLFERQYPKDRFLKELDQEARYYYLMMGASINHLSSSRKIYFSCPSIITVYLIPLPPTFVEAAGVM